MVFSGKIALLQKKRLSRLALTDQRAQYRTYLQLNLSGPPLGRSVSCESTVIAVGPVKFASCMHARSQPVIRHREATCSHKCTPKATHVRAVSASNGVDDLFAGCGHRLTVLAHDATSCQGSRRQKGVGCAQIELPVLFLPMSVQRRTEPVPKRRSNRPCLTTKNRYTTKASFPSCE